MLDAYVYTIANLALLFAIPFGILLAATAANDAIVTLRRRRDARRAHRAEHPYGPR